MIRPQKKLVLETGEEFYGTGFGADCRRVCEIVFNTSVVGYQEIISDPSYADQIVVMTRRSGQVGGGPGRLAGLRRFRADEVEVDVFGGLGRLALLGGAQLTLQAGEQASQAAARQEQRAEQSRQQNGSPAHPLFFVLFPRHIRLPPQVSIIKLIYHSRPRLVYPGGAKRGLRLLTT